MQKTDTGISLIEQIYDVLQRENPDLNDPQAALFSAGLAIAFELKMTNDDILHQVRGMLGARNKI